MPIAIGELAYTVPISTGKQRLNGLGQTQADNVAHLYGGQYLQAQIATSLLHARDNVGLGIHQRSVPVKYDQIKSSRHHHLPQAPQHGLEFIVQGRGYLNLLLRPRQAETQGFGM